ncbi:MAG TPA: methionyl-tRNA formyltransferase, partial [Spirochaetota bacterium]
MKVGFFGTPGIAARCLETLSREHEICFVVSQEDKPYGRSLRITKSPVSQIAQKLSIPLITPATLKDEVLPMQLSSFGADIFVVVAYGKIIPRSIFALPKFGSINLHPSLLPHLRGAAPVESALLRGDTVSGITIQCISERLDAGDILAQKKIELSPDMTADELYEIVIPRGAELLSRVLRDFESGTVARKEQDESQATYCSKITKESARINWESPSAMIHNLVRAYNPKPVAWTTFRGSGVRIWRTGLFSGDHPKLMPGEIAVFQKRHLLVGT